MITCKTNVHKHTALAIQLLSNLQLFNSHPLSHIHCSWTAPFDQIGNQSIVTKDVAIRNPNLLIMPCYLQCLTRTVDRYKNFAKQPLSAKFKKQGSRDLRAHVKAELGEIDLKAMGNVDVSDYASKHLFSTTATGIFN